MHSDDRDSVVSWLERVQDHDESAAIRIWDRYFQRLLERASRRLQYQRVRRVADAEDAVANAFQSFFRRAQEGRFPNIKSHDDLWRLLLTITERKCKNLIRHERAQVRGHGNVRGDSLADQIGPDSCLGQGMDMFGGSSLAPDAEVAIEETLTILMDLLSAQDEELPKIATLRMEGWTNGEIADEIGKSVATVERRLKIIREIWKAFHPGGDVQDQADECDAT